MYADRVEEEGGVKRLVKERLNDNASNNFIPRRQITGKRQRQDDKWEHDLYKEDVHNVSNRKVDAQDLRLKLQRKNIQNASRTGTGTGRGTLSGGPRDLREKLSGTMNTQPINDDPPTVKVKVSQPARKSVAVETSEPEPKRVAKTAARKKAKPNALIVGRIFGLTEVFCPSVFCFCLRRIHQWRASCSLWVSKNMLLPFKPRKLI